MVFTPTTLFKAIACPEGVRCRLTNCIYSHDGKPEQGLQPTPAFAIPVANNQSESAERPAEPAAKRRKVTYDSLADKPASRADIIRNQLVAAKKGDGARVADIPAKKPYVPATLERPVTPPPNANVNTGKPTPLAGNAQTHPLGPRKAQRLETLNARLIANDPAGHQKRSLYLKALHSEMARLNQAMKDSKGIEFRHALICTEQEIISLSLSMEEKVAREQPALYSNVVKQQVANLRKMKIEDWASYVKASLFNEQPKPVKKEEKVIVTGLPLSQEHLILPQLVVDQKPLAAHGYIPVPPSEQEAAEAAAAVKASAYYETCDRCAARFQVFPERDENGKLSANGPCKYHPYRKVFPQRAKTDKETGAKEPYYPCCNEPVGAPGCTRDEEHVFKTSSPARLAAIMPFVVTPENPTPAKDRSGQDIHAVTFDCEMGYTVFGMELIRLTAVSWPSGDELIDILVRPLGAVIDLNSRFSGVFPEHFKHAIPYDEWQRSPPHGPPEDGERPLPIVESPARARNLLCSFLKPTTPLIGHAIDNDLNTVRLCHPTIIDTVILFAHPRGLPLRFGLKMLSTRHLGRAIQQGGDRGHDSKEDAIATGDLVRVKVGEKWRTMRSSGWQIVNDQLVAPPLLGRSAVDEQQTGMEQSAQALVSNGIAGKKRKKSEGSVGGTDGAADSETDEGTARAVSRACDNSA